MAILPIFIEFCAYLLKKKKYNMYIYDVYYNIIYKVNNKLVGKTYSCFERGKCG